MNKKRINTFGVYDRSSEAANENAMLNVLTKAKIELNKTDARPAYKENYIDFAFVKQTLVNMIKQKFSRGPSRAGSAEDQGDVHDGIAHSVVPVMLVVIIFLFISPIIGYLILVIYMCTIGFKAASATDAEALDISNMSTEDMNKKKDLMLKKALTEIAKLKPQDVQRKYVPVPNFTPGPSSFFLSKQKKEPMTTAERTKAFYSTFNKTFDALEAFAKTEEAKREKITVLVSSKSEIFTTPPLSIIRDYIDYAMVLKGKYLEFYRRDIIKSYNGVMNNDDKVALGKKYKGKYIEYTYPDNAAKIDGYKHLYNGNSNGIIISIADYLSKCSRETMYNYHNKMRSVVSNAVDVSFVGFDRYETYGDFTDKTDFSMGKYATDNEKEIRAIHDRRINKAYRKEEDYNDCVVAMLFWDILHELMNESHALRQVAINSFMDGQKLLYGELDYHAATLYEIYEKYCLKK